MKLFYFCSTLTPNPQGLVSVLCSGFHTTPVRLQRPEHPLFPQIDWTQTKAGKYAVVDPFDPANILYLTHREYVIQSRVAMSNDMDLVVLATPRDSPPHDQSSSSSSDLKNSPPLGSKRADWLKGYTRKASRYFQAETRRNRVARLMLAFSSTLAKWVPVKVSFQRSLETVREGARKGEKVVSTIEVTGRNASDIVLDWGNLLWFRLFGGKTSFSFGKGLGAYGRYLAMLVYHTGALNAVLRLKAELFAVLSYVAGVPLKTTESLGIRVRLRGGLPASLPSSTRLAIRQGNLSTLRVWISILNMYGAFQADHPQPSLGNITFPKWDESTSGLWEDFQSFCKYKWSRIMTRAITQRGPGTKFFATDEVYSSSKAGPYGKSLVSARIDLICWLLKATWETNYFDSRVITPENQYEQFRSWWAYAQGNYESLLSKTPLGRMMKVTRDRRLSRVIMLLVVLTEFPGLGPSCIPQDLKPLFECKWDYDRGGYYPHWAIQKGLNAPRLAKLVALREPAGKVRNIVCFDWWSQAMFLPVHRFMMNALSGFSSDATFDQDARVQEFSKRGYLYLASLDLKTATEMIPQQLYRAVMEVLLGSEIVEPWLDLLVDRDIYPTKDYWCSSHHDTFRYVRGQPMGALSSWAAMALVHHALVQFSASLAGWSGLFEDYLVLGDDVIIANEGVAESYVRVLEDLGVKIGLNKSFISRNGFGNFAGRSFLRGDDLSPISLSEEIMVRGPSARVEMALRALRRGLWSLSDAGWLNSLLRHLFSKSAWEQIRDWRYQGKVDPLLRAAFMATFGVPEKVETLAGIQGFSVRSFFAGLILTLKIFGMPLSDYYSKRMVNNRNVDVPVVSAILVKSKALERQYRPLWEQLSLLSVEPDRKKKYLSIVPDGALSSDLEWLRDIIELYDTFERVLERFRQWRIDHMRLVRTINVAAGDGNMSPWLLEFTCELSLEEIWRKLSEAERTLPVALDYLLGKEVPERLVSPDANSLSLDKLLSSLTHLVETSMPPCPTSETYKVVSPEGVDTQEENYAAEVTGAPSV